MEFLFGWLVVCFVWFDVGLSHSDWIKMKSQSSFSLHFLDANEVENIQNIFQIVFLDSTLALFPIF